MQAGKKREAAAEAAQQDDSAVKREEFLAALKTLEPVPPGDDSQDTIFSDGTPRERRDAVIAEIADGVRSEADRESDGPTAAKGAARKSRGEASDATPEETADGGGAVTKVDSLHEVTGGGEEGAFTFEAMVREVLSQELRRWVEDNLEEVTMRVVREELHQMGRRREQG